MQENISLFDQFLVIGLKEEITEKDYEELKGLSLKNLQIIGGFIKENQPEYLQNVKFWCFPNGFHILNEDFSCISSENIREKHKKSLESFEKIEHFVMTDEKSVKRYCSFLTIYEKQYIKRHKNDSISKVFPKISLSRLIKNPLALNHKDLELIYVPKALCLISRMPIFDLQVQFLKLLQEKVLIPKRNRDFQKKNEENIAGFFSGFWHKISRKIPEFFTNFIPFGPDLKIRTFKISMKKSIKETSLFEFYSSTLFTLLKISDQDQLKVYEDFNNENPSEILRFQMSNSPGLNLPSFDFWLLFEKLDIDNILKLFSCFLLEKQMIFFSNSSKELINICETMLSLINPLTWGCIYIPFLPIEMWETLYAMMPFIIGIERTYKEEIEKKIKFDDKVIVDLLLNKVIYKEEFVLPRYIEGFLKQNLKEILKGKRDLKGVLKVKQVFLNAMYLIINNIVPFFNEEVDLAKNSNRNSSEIFNFEAFLDIFNENQEKSGFMVEFTTNTMMFNKFIEDCFCVLRPNLFDSEVFLDDAAYFLKELDKIQRNNPFIELDIATNPSIFSDIIQEQDCEIQRLLMKFQENLPEKRSLLPYFLNYLSNKPRKTKEKRELTLKSLNKSLKIVPKLTKPIEILKPKSPTRYNKLELSVKNPRKKTVIQRLASYENSENREGCSPNSRLITKIKHFYVYYHAIKRNQTFGFKRPTYKKKSPEKQKENCFKFVKEMEEKKIINEEIPEEKPFLIEEKPCRNEEKPCRNKEKTFKNEENTCKHEEKQIFPEKKQKTLEYLTPFFKGFPHIQIKDENNLMINPQDSSCEVTPNVKTRLEPESFGKWMMENSMKTKEGMERLKENFKGEGLLDKRFVTRSLSPKKIMRNLF